MQYLMYSFQKLLVRVGLVLIYNLLVAVLVVSSQATNPPHHIAQYIVHVQQKAQ